MRVESLHVGVTKEDVVAATGFELIWPERIPTSGEPTKEELDLLRNEVDPMKYIIGREAV